MTLPKWQGIFPAITTKFHADESLDLQGTAKHIDYLIRNGVHGLVTCGSLGEASTLTLEEKLLVADCALKASAGRVPVLANVSETSTREALRYIRGANALGVDGYMVMPSVIYAADAREAMANVRTMAEEAQKPIMVYNNPVAYKVDLKPEHMAELADCNMDRRHQGKHRQHPPHHRPAQPAGQPLPAVHAVWTTWPTKAWRWAATACWRAWAAPSRVKTWPCTS